MSRLREFWNESKKGLTVALSGGVAATGAIVALEGQDSINRGEELKSALVSNETPATSLEQQEIEATSKILRGQSDKRVGFGLTAIGGGLLGGSALRRKKTMTEHAQANDDTRVTKER